ncbi:S41 family peptidase [Crocinitomix catalasitica]|uniref:S41 family peptidase n=1 Tax=Crocinitomix catalasitica TaxID=184607 RepID=UPI000489FAF6|nr:S41 family peptidase [Crocinitomix catalasitica]
MMKLSLCLIFITFSLLVASQEYLVKASIKEQVEDFKVFKTTLIECHSGIYDYNDSTSLYTGLNSLEAKINSRPMTRIELVASYSKFVSSLKCIHTWVYQENVAIKFLDAKYELPFHLYFVNNTLFSKEDYRSDKNEIDKNDQIVAINGELISDLKDSLYQFISSDGNNTSRKDQVLKHNFLYYYFLFKQRETNFLLQYIHKGDTLKGVFNSRYSQNKNKNRKKYNSMCYSIDTLTSHAVLVLPIPLLANKKYEKRLESFMEEIKSRKIKNLVLDLRNNGGGKSQQFLAGFFISSKIAYGQKNYSSIHTATYKKYFLHKMNPQFLVSNLMGRYTSGKVSNSYITPQEQYRGKLFILINGNTGSAASNFAAILKEWGNATIVGEESGGGYNSYNTGGGTLQLPNSKIRITIRSIKSYNNIPQKFSSSGVTPHYKIKESSTFDCTIDPQLNFIVNELILTKPKLH